MALNVKRNTILLAAALAVNSCLFQLAAAVNSITFVQITGIEGLLGLGPAIFLASSGLAALPAGRAMDHFGRVPVIAVGFVIASLGCSLVALATRTGSTAVVITGMALTGAAGGVALLARTAAGDMYPPERRARGISYVLFGSVFGAILGPAVFAPIFAGRKLEPEALNDTNRLELRVFGDDDLKQAVLVAKLDNLGKGASGAAVQNLDLMLGR